MKGDPNAPKFKGVAQCGCTVWLYSAEFDTPKQRVKALSDALREGLQLVELKTEADTDQARKEWGACPHSQPIYTRDEATERALELLGDYGPLTPTTEKVSR